MKLKSYICWINIHQWLMLTIYRPSKKIQYRIIKYFFYKFIDLLFNMMTLTLSNTKTQFNITSPNLLESRYSLCRCAGWYERSVALLWLWWAKWTCVCLGTSGSEDYTDRPDPKKNTSNFQTSMFEFKYECLRFLFRQNADCRIHNNDNDDVWYYL